jgi:hypothetical protein
MEKGSHPKIISFDKCTAYILPEIFPAQLDGSGSIILFQTFKFNKEAH